MRGGPNLSERGAGRGGACRETAAGATPRRRTRSRGQVATRTRQKSVHVCGSSGQPAGCTESVVMMVKRGIATAVICWGKGWVRRVSDRIPALPEVSLQIAPCVTWCSCITAPLRSGTGMCAWPDANMACMACLCRTQSAHSRGPAALQKRKCLGSDMHKRSCLD